MNFNVHRSSLINEHAVSTDEFSDFFRRVRQDQTVIIYERLFIRNNTTRKEYLLYCNVLKYACWVDITNLNAEQVRIMETVFIYDWKRKIGDLTGAFYPQVHRRWPALEMMISNSRYDDKIDDLVNQFNQLHHEPEEPIEERWD